MQFVGICSGAETLELGQEAAAKDAASKIAQFLGSRVRTEYSERSTEISQHLVRQIRSQSSAQVSGSRVIDWYYETLIRISGSRSTERHEVFVLVSYPRAEAELERRRQQRERAGVASSALARYQEGRAAEGRGDLRGAARSYRQSRALLEGLESSVALSDAQIRDTIELGQVVERRLADVRVSLRRFALRVEVDGHAVAASAFRAALSEALSSRGYQLSRALPWLEIGGRVSVTAGGIAIENRVVSANGGVWARRMDDGAEIVSSQVQSKGLHRLVEQAAVNAATDAGTSAGEALADGLDRYENE